jgi:replicative DNA helicase
VQLERQVLGGCLIRPELLEAAPLLESDFFAPAHARIWCALAWLKAERQEIDTVRLGLRLKDLGQLESVGGTEYLLELTNTIPPPTLPVERLRRFAILRRMQEVSATLAARIGSGSDPSAAFEALERMREELRVVDSPEGRFASLADIVEQMTFDGRRIRTGLDTLDAALRGGIPPGSFCVLVGAPGAAKTTFAVFEADSFNRFYDATCLYLAADEDRKGIVVRLGQIEGFPREGLESPHSTVRRAFAHKLRARPGLMVRDALEERVTLEEAAELLERAAGDRVRVLIVDSLQTVPCAAAALAENKRDQIEAVIEACKRIAKRGAIVIAISEMSRGGYRTGDRQSDTSALSSGKESGAIEYGAALVLGLHNVKGEKGVVDIEVAKNRIGSEKPDIRVRINFERASFIELSPPPEEQGKDKASERLELAKERVRETIRANRDLTSQREVLALCKGTREHNSDAFKLMVKRGEIVVLDGCFRLQERLL